MSGEVLPQPSLKRSFSLISLTPVKITEQVTDECVCTCPHSKSVDSDLTRFIEDNVGITKSSLISSVKSLLTRHRWRKSEGENYFQKSNTHQSEKPHDVSCVLHSQKSTQLKEPASRKLSSDITKLPVDADLEKSEETPPSESVPSTVVVKCILVLFSIGLLDFLMICPI